MQGAPTSLKVSDLTHVPAGPFCACQLALPGADVLKIESPDAPDCALGRGPDPELNARGPGLNCQAQGENKRSLAVDLRHARGRAALAELVKKADVPIENLTTGAMDRTLTAEGVIS